ncbi:MAG: DUF3850 domain-containing protein [Candidatus Electrothrix sp. AUS1_2]|nr:DUF3850 domain-containing protein [Candidatus Electrothrix sp. AUS1_2]
MKMLRILALLKKGNFGSLIIFPDQFLWGSLVLRWFSPVYLNIPPVNADYRKKHTKEFTNQKNGVIEMKKHELKILPEYFDDAVSMRKPFEIRNNDFSFSLGDMVVLKEWSPDSGYTGREISPRFIDYIFRSPSGLNSDYIVLHPDYFVLLLRPCFSFISMFEVVFLYAFFTFLFCLLGTLFF